jgi:Flp pilus assembly protein TadD
VVFKHCAPCHRPGEVAPFPLLSYEDARKRARQIAEVTAARQMPPWMPVEGFGTFVGERRLSAHEIDLISRWAEAGAPEGDPAETPGPPEFVTGWQLGEPDLVAAMPEPFLLPAEGLDVYRNVVLAHSLDQPRFVRAIEFRPGDTSAVHHTFVLVDPGKTSRRLDEAAPGAGYPGMDPGGGAQSPGGHFISWQPGKIPNPGRDGFAWRLSPGMDIVAQLHLRPTGKPENVQVRVGFYFTDSPPTHTPYKIVLATKEIDIPAGSPETVIENRYILPVDAFVLGVVPHAHYLAKQLHGFATLPDGSTRWIIRIDDWDFDWQGDYQLANPLPLPKGSVITQRFTYDNSADNPQNPNSPPVRVTYGTQSTDEMAELWLQLLPARPGELPDLQRDYARWNLTLQRDALERAVAAGTATPRDHTTLAKVLITAGELDAALAHLDQAIAAAPAEPEPYFLLGVAATRRDDLAAARQAFEGAVQRDPAHAGALNGLGTIALRNGDLGAAASYYRRALASDPEQPIALANLGLVLLRQGNPSEAIPLLESALALDPDSPSARANLERARAAVGR